MHFAVLICGGLARSHDHIPELLSNLCYSWSRSSNVSLVGLPKVSGSRKHSKNATKLVIAMIKNGTHGCI